MVLYVGRNDNQAKGDTMNENLTVKGNADIAFGNAGRVIEMLLSGRSERTIEAYRADLINFTNYLGVDTTEDAARVLLTGGPGNANMAALNYRNHLIDQDKAPATINRCLAALRSLVKLARVTGDITWQLEVEGVKAEPRKDTSGPGRRAVVTLLSDTGKSKKAVRDRAIIRLLYDLGLRRGEVVSLDVEDVDTEAQKVRVKAKGHREKQTLTMPDQTTEALQAWLDVRDADQGALFINADRASKGNGRLTADGLYRMIRKRGDRAGLKVRPHGIRHTAITTALDLVNGDVRAAAKFSRHRDIRTLTVYDDSRQDLNGEVAKKVAAVVGG